MCAGNRLALKHPSDAKTRTTGRVVDHGPRSAEAPLGFVGEPAHAELAFAIIGPSVVVQDRVDAGARAVAEGAADRAARVCVSRSEFPLGDRQSVVSGKSVSVRVYLVGRRLIKKKK